MFVFDSGSEVMGCNSDRWGYGGDYCEIGGLAQRALGGMGCLPSKKSGQIGGTKLRIILQNLVFDFCFFFF